MIGYIEPICCSLIIIDLVNHIIHQLREDKIITDNRIEAVHGYERYLRLYQIINIIKPEFCWQLKAYIQLLKNM